MQLCQYLRFLLPAIEQNLVSNRRISSILCKSTRVISFYCPFLGRRLAYSSDSGAVFSLLEQEIAQSEAVKSFQTSLFAQAQAVISFFALVFARQGQ